jgi:hypothetical protein
MWVALNDLSVTPSGNFKTEPWLLVLGFLKTYEKMRKLGVSQMRVPPGFLHQPLGGGNKSLVQYSYDSIADDEQRQLIKTIRDTRMDDTSPIFEAEMASWDGQIFLVHHQNGYSNESYSDLLTEAHFSKHPIISFAFEPYCISVLTGSLKVLNEIGNIQTIKEITLPNYWSNSEIRLGDKILNDLKLRYQFLDFKWDALDNPVWATDLANDILVEKNFPLVSQVPDEKMEILTATGTRIAVLNGWILDQDVTSKNNKGAKRLIFRPLNSRRMAYISIDFRHGDGRFELFDRRGKHKGEVFFKGGGIIPDTKDNTGNHDIEVD